MKIGELAKIADVNIDTIRYYEKAGVLPEPLRRPSGYRDYDESTLRRLRFVRNAKRLAFSLLEITELLALSSGSDMAHIRNAAKDKLATVEARITDLTRMKEALGHIIRECPGHGPGEECPIVQSLASPNEVLDGRL